MPEDSPFASSHLPSPPQERRNLFQHVLGILSGFRLCVVLLTALFIYSSIGSAGLFYPVGGDVTDWAYGQIRQWPMFEMTEFEWFHTPFFYALCALLGVNMTLATFLRIPFTPLKYGAWMIHSGIVVLLVGAVIYFGTKVEGDTPVWRRTIVVSVEDAPSVTLPAIVGRGVELRSDEGIYTFQVVSIDPEWELLSGDEVGERAYSVSVQVRTPRNTFVRQLIAERPQYTQDILPGEGRVKTIERYGGAALLDEPIALSMLYDVQDRFWVKDSSALYLRETTSPTWTERRMKGLPRYNEYLTRLEDAFSNARGPAMERGIDLTPRVEEGDPLEDVRLRVTGYLPYAEIRTRFEQDPGAPLNPVAFVELSTPGATPSRMQLVAFDPDLSVDPRGFMRFSWVDDGALYDALDDGATSVLTLEVPGAGERVELTFGPGNEPSPHAPFTPIGDSGYAYRVSSLIPALPINNVPVAIAIVEIESPEGRFTRWIADDPSLTRDMEPGAHAMTDGAARALDDRLVSSFSAIDLAPLTLVGTPDRVDSAKLVIAPQGDTLPPSTIDLVAGAEPTVVAPAAGLSVRLAAIHQRTYERTKPMIVHPSQRLRNNVQMRWNAMVQVEITHNDRTQMRWVPYHHFAFDSPSYYTPSHGRYQPAVVTLDDGRALEMIFSRETRPLPNPIALDDFVLDTRVGGYTTEGGALSIVNWTSQLRFLQGDGTWSDARPVSANNPKSFGDLWFFQSSWDPPRDPSPSDPDGHAGLNHTGLGVGNREGVWTMLIGSCISVLGMIYAFYVKPVLKRSKRRKVERELEPATPLGADEGERRVMLTRGLVVWFLIGVALAGATAYLALTGALRSAKGDEATFAGQVDLAPLDRSAVYTKGRLKSFDSFANEMVGMIMGPHRIADRPTDFLYLDLMIMPQLYEDEATIFVKKKPIRKTLADAASVSLDTMSGRQADALRADLETFMETGLITDRVLALPTVRDRLAAMQRDVVKTAKFVNAIRNAVGLRNPDTLGGLLRVIPPASGDGNEPWLAPMDFFGDGVVEPTPGMIAAGALPPQRREALRLAFGRLADLWYQARTIEERTEVEPLDRAAFQVALERWSRSLPDGLVSLRTSVDPLIDGIAELDQAARTERLRAIDGRILELASDAPWDVIGPFYAMDHRHALSLPQDQTAPSVARWAGRTSDAVASFAALLPDEDGLGAALYPDAFKMEAESWYFKLGGATWIWIVYLLSLLMLLMAVVYKWSGARAMGMGLFFSAFAMHTFVLGWRWYVSGRWPNSNMFEAVTTSVWLGTLCVLALELIARRTPMRNMFALGAAGASMVAMMAATYLPELDANISNMMPILHDLWLYIHTNVIIASYALIGMSAVTGLLYLGWRALGKGPDHATVGGTDMLLRTAPGASGLKRRVSAGAVFDGATMILIELSFILLWAGLVMGAIWADHSWGRPWGWDPKEVFALNTFFVYLVLIHIRLSSKDKGLWTALLALVGCGVMLFNWIVINFVISGLHSYA